MKNILCKLGIHRYKWKLVFSKKKFEHKRGWEEIDYDKNKHWIDGRECKNCGKQQYLWYYWVTCGYSNVL